MAALTEESPNKFNKPDLVALVVSLQSKTNSVNSDLVPELSKIREGCENSAGKVPSIPGESASRFQASHDQSVTMISRTLLAKQ